MDEHRELLLRTLLARHHVVVSGPWIPWQWIVEIHDRLPDPALIALFDAYRLVYAAIDLDRLSRVLGTVQDVNPCWRCGWCCAHLNPGTVSMEEYMELAKRRALIRRFLRPDPGPPPVPRSYRPWYYREKPLRMCPFLFVCQEGGRYFCAVHEKTCGLRPASCREFIATPPHCELPRRPLVF